MAPKQSAADPQYLDEHHQRISEFAADYFDDDERDEFVDRLMERRGYQRTTGWSLPPEPSPDGGQGGGAPPAGPPASKHPYFKR